MQVGHSGSEEGIFVALEERSKEARKCLNFFLSVGLAI